MVNNLAKIFDRNALQNQGPDNGMEPPQALHVERSDVSTSESFNIMDVKFASLEEKIDKLLTLQENVLKKLNSVSQEICCIEKDVEMVKAETSEPGSRMERNKKMRNNEVKRLCLKMKKSLSDINRKAEQQVKRLDGLEQSVSGLQKLVGPLVERVKTLIVHNSSVKHHVKKRKACKAGAGHPFRMHIFSETTAGDLLKKKNEKVSPGLCFILAGIIASYGYVLLHVQLFFVLLTFKKEQPICSKSEKYKNRLCKFQWKKYGKIYLLYRPSFFSNHSFAAVKHNNKEHKKD